jgi:hypothetical protein
MKLHPKTLMLCCLLIISLAACKKTTTSPGIDSNKIKTYAEEVTNMGNKSGDTLNVSYDNSNRIVSFISQHSGAQYLYNYVSNTKYILEIRYGAQLATHVECYLNSNSFVDSVFQYNVGDDSVTTKYFYDASSRLIEGRFYNYSLTRGSSVYRRYVYTYNSEGNLLNEYELSSGNDTNMIKTYSYTNMPGNSYTFPMVNLPQQYNKLPAGYTLHSPIPNITVETSFTYDFDTQNRVLRERQTNSSGNRLVKTYEYY